MMHGRFLRQLRALLWWPQHVEEPRNVVAVMQQADNFEMRFLSCQRRRKLGPQRSGHESQAVLVLAPGCFRAWFWKLRHVI